MRPDPCTSARTAIMMRDFVGWQGLPAECSGQELFDITPADLEGRPGRLLGNDFDPAVFVLLSLEGYYRPMASFREGKLVLFDAMNPELRGGFDWLRSDLGEPAARMDWYYGTLAIAAGEWAYPERGITIFVNTEANRALHVALYYPASLEEYRNRLRPHLRKEPWPRQRSVGT